MRAHSYLPVLLAALAVATPLKAAEPVRLGPPKIAGVTSYRYESAEILNGAQHGGYKVDFDLVTTRDGVIDAVIRSTQAFLPGEGWTTPAIAPACLKAMRAPADGIARVRLWPLTPEAMKFGPSFLDDCAPGAVFFPLTDLLNVTSILTSPRFHTAQLRRVGDKATYPGFSTSFDRAGEGFKETAHGGDVRLLAVNGADAVLDWSPTPADLELTQTGPQGAPLHLTGAEHWAFRLDIDPRTSALIRARTTYDEIAVTVTGPGIPTSPPLQLKISRTVSIEPQSPP